MTDFGVLALLMGGKSAEREISLESAKSIHAALNRLGYEVLLADGLDGLRSLKEEQKIDTVFNILHGADGEDGTLAAWLEQEGFAYTGCDHLGGVLSWYKDKSKLLVSDRGVKTPKSQCLTRSDALLIEGEGPWIVKPADEGSSVGLFKADNADQLKQAVNDSFKLATRILVEDYVEGVECTVGIVGDHVLPVVSIKPEGVLYDYHAKYNSRKTNYDCPALLNDDIQVLLQEDAMKSFDALELKGWARVDFIVDENGQRWFLEANTTPGITDSSLLPKAAAVYGWGFDQLVQNILNTSRKGAVNE